MKHTQLIVNIVLVLAVAGLYTLHLTGIGQPGAVDANSPLAAAGEKAPAGSIVYVQLDSLMSAYDLSHDLQATLEAKLKGIEDDLAKRARNFEWSMNDAREKIEKGLVTRSQAEQLQQQLAKKEQDLMAYREQMRVEMTEEQTVMVRQVYNAITTYLQQYNVSNNYLILGTSTTTNTVLQGQPGLDITKEILDGLNAAYVRPKSN